MKNKYTLITGASSGIGLEIAACMADKGHNLILTARRENILMEASNDISEKYKVKVDYIAADLSDIDAPERIFNYCEENDYEVDVLVNNAGYGIPTSFHETSMEEEEKFIRVLGISVIAMTKIFLSGMIERGYGRIMIVSSVAAFSPPSSIQPLYGPIKTFMNRFSDGINLNYNHKGITSTAVCPGFTVTGFHTASGVQDEMDRVPSFMKLSATRVASEGVEATLSGKPLCIPSKTYKTLVFILKYVPESILTLLGKGLAPGRYDKK
ncbi:SDR family NAD(P)-dependent oxidoreductase [Gammaproteobacteria bacterium]|jgi:short-subunit dehydrogenase|nr:SDR family NAD(P)-dependent oxidoreductase [Gammaproteobacteria bacterium]MDC0406187.1 SDR family NAD(P)-dependent oxidoreductase [Gammaproteobacteria bacterium]MDC0536554.1 SDR family NAD(P)-dependent oxidoreductase [Gammaproteobacteria bacterium]MDC1149818.1 SDR family NAD(P)-dependent oxidoreductase [Gammaproteobacteria bacterium]|tara:strand:- start:1050 stop:1850 length:801 start_codon:yes stop_codon:yes gene_type:complete